MDLSASPRPSRRSFPNLTHLSLAPLSSRFPIDDDPALDNDTPDVHMGRRASYIQPQTTPATPSILSRSNSRVRNGTRKKRATHYAYEGHTWRSTPDDLSRTSMSKAKSSTDLLTARPDARRHPYHQQYPQQRAYPPHTPKQYRTPKSPIAPQDEWLHRAGLVIASEARDAKGQSWLVTRTSSTSLHILHDNSSTNLNHGSNRSSFDNNDDDYVSQRSQLTAEYGADDEYSPATPRLASRTTSRVPSAFPSRRGSRAGLGSKIELMTPATVGFGYVGDDYFSMQTGDEPDFVDPEEYSDDDAGADPEDEVYRLRRDRSFGLGGWVDRLVNWSLFEEDGELSDEEDEDDGDTDSEGNRRREAAVIAEEKARRELEERRRFERLAGLQRKEEMKENEPVPVSEPNEDQEGGWQDAAWLLSVASKVLL